MEPSSYLIIGFVAGACVMAVISAVLTNALNRRARRQ